MLVLPAAPPVSVAWALVWPAGIVTDGVTVAMLVSVVARLTPPPPVGAAVVSVTLKLTEPAGGESTSAGREIAPSAWVVMVAAVAAPLNPPLALPPIEQLPEV